MNYSTLDCAIAALAEADRLERKGDLERAIGRYADAAALYRKAGEPDIARDCDRWAAKCGTTLATRLIAALNV